MPVCFVPNCKSGYRSHKQKVSMFTAPKNPTLLEEWVRKIPRKDRVLRAGVDYVCEKHFAPDSILRNFEVSLPGEIFKMQRGRPMLKPGAVPTIFPGCPKYLTSISKKRKPPRKREPIPPKKQSYSKNTELPAKVEVKNEYVRSVCSSDSSFENESEYVVSVRSSDSSFEIETERVSSVRPTSPSCKIENECVSSVCSSTKTHEIIWNKLKNEITSSNSWTFSPVPAEKSVALLHWVQGHIIDKKIIIDENLIVKVYVGNIPLPVEGFQNINSSDKALQLVDIVGNIVVCDNAFSGMKCHGYASKRNSKCGFCTHTARSRRTGEGIKRKKSLK